jgi:hypothetical protein
VSRGHVPVAPVAPDVTGVRWRRDLRMSELAKLEAEIQALWAPDVLELTVAAADAGRSYKNRRAAAHLADRVARDRQRRGRKPTERGSELGLQVSFHPNGSRVVRRVAPDATPEQIAGGEQPPVPDSDR